MGIMPYEIIFFVLLAIFAVGMFWLLVVRSR
jgi:hypothetical protein